MVIFKEAALSSAIIAVSGIGSESDEMTICVSLNANLHLPGYEPKLPE